MINMSTKIYEKLKVTNNNGFMYEKKNASIKNPSNTILYPQ